MKILTLCVCMVVLSGCASQLDIRDGDCSITRVQVDATTNAPFVGGVEADGWVLVSRGDCSDAMIDLFRDGIGLEPAAARPSAVIRTR